MVIVVKDGVELFWMRWQVSFGTMFDELCSRGDDLADKKYAQFNRNPCALFVEVVARSFSHLFVLESDCSTLKPLACLPSRERGLLQISSYHG